MKRTFSIGTAAILLLALAIPQASAGDKDWATAGKVLAGVVGFGFLHNALSGGHHHHRSYRSTRYYSEPCSSTSYTYTRRHDYRPYHRSYTRTEVYCPPVTPVYHTTSVVREPAPVIVPAPVPVPSSPDPVIVNLEDGRRIYQPRIKGHVAYLQIYSEHSGSWLTLKEYPSLY